MHKSKCGLINRMKRTLLLFALFILCQVLVTGSLVYVSGLRAYGNDTLPRLAILDFKSDASLEKKALSISELLRNEFARRKQYQVLERSQIDSLLREHQLIQSGVAEKKEAVKLGKLVSARKVMIGRVIKYGDTIVISGRIIDIEKGIADSGANASACPDDDILEVVSLFVDNITGEKGASESEVRIKAGKKTYSTWEDITVTFSNFPGTRHDYISLAEKGSGPDDYYTYQYTRSKTSGSITFRGGVARPGTYEVRAHTKYSEGKVEYQASYTITVESRR